MLLSSMITEIGAKIDRTDKDDRIKRCISQAIDYLFNKLPVDKLLKTTTLTTTASTETVSLPDDFGSLLSLQYTPGDGTGYEVTILSDSIYKRKFTDNIQTLLKPDFAAIINDKIYIYPIPSEAYTLTIEYYITKPCIYTHNLSLIHDASASSNGVAVYLDEDAEETGIGKLYFTSPTSANGKLTLQMADGHIHTVTIYDSDTASTLGNQLYFDEDGNNTDSTGYQRAIFVSPTNIDCVVKTDIYKGHYHYIYITDDPNAASNGAAVYLDEDAVVKGNRLLFNSPTTTSGSLELALSKTGIIPPFLENYDEAIQAKAALESFVLDKDWNAVNVFKDTLRDLLSGIHINENVKRPIVVQPQSFGVNTRQIDILKYPTIDD